MNILRLDSIVFETPDVGRARAFYVDLLGLRVGTYEKDGRTVADENDRYFNLDLGGTLLGFELGAAQTGTIVLKVIDLPVTVAALAAQGVTPRKATADFAILTDPDGREVILQA